MRSQDSDLNPLIVALQADLPSPEDDARMRAKLAAAGACIGASVLGASVLKAGSTNLAVSGGLSASAAAAKGASAALAVKGSGVVSTLLAALPLSGAVGVKTLVVVGALATGVSYPWLEPKLAAVLRNDTNGAPAVERVEPALVLPTGIPSRVTVDRARTAQTEKPSNELERVSLVPQQGAVASRDVEPVMRAATMSRESSSATLPGRSRVTKQRTVATARAESTLDKDALPVTAVQDTAAASVAVQTSESPELKSEAPQASLLIEETALIERALRAQRAGDKNTARNLLGVHEQQFPRGRLAIERNRMLAQLRD